MSLCSPGVLRESPSGAPMLHQLETRVSLRDRGMVVTCYSGCQTKEISSFPQAKAAQQSEPLSLPAPGMGTV